MENRTEKTCCHICKSLVDKPNACRHIERCENFGGPVDQRRKVLFECAKLESFEKCGSYVMTSEIMQHKLNIPKVKKKPGPKPKVKEEYLLPASSATLRTSVPKSDLDKLREQNKNSKKLCNKKDNRSDIIEDSADLEKLREENENLKRLLTEKDNYSDITGNYVYLIQRPESWVSRCSFYKIGKTTNFIKRGHPKNSRIMCVLHTDDMNKMEAKLLDEFNKNFHKKKDLGEEVFEGDIKNMRSIFLQLYLKENNIVDEDWCNTLYEILEKNDSLKTKFLNHLNK